MLPAVIESTDLTFRTTIIEMLIESRDKATQSQQAWIALACLRVCGFFGRHSSCLPLFFVIHSSEWRRRFRDLILDHAIKVTFSLSPHETLILIAFTVFEKSYGENDGDLSLYKR
jgi:hypothetical protein